MTAKSLLRQAKAISLLVPALALLCQAQPGEVVGWGTSLGRSAPKPGDEYMAICAGGYHCLALTATGSVVAWGENTNGQCNVPLGSDFVAIAAGLYHNLALRTDGTVVAWGGNSRRQCSVPPQTKFLAIAAGTWHSLGVRADGSLVAWGWNDEGQCNVPPGRDYVEVSGGYYHSLAIKVDRSLVAWGGNGDGQCNVPVGRDFVRIAAGSMHNLALKADGTVVAWGRSNEGQCRVPAGNDFIAIAAGGFHSLALRANGRVEAWGQNDYGQCETPAQDRIAAIAAGKFHSLAIRDNRAPLAAAPRTKTPDVKPTTDAGEKKDLPGSRMSPGAAEKPLVTSPVAAMDGRSTKPAPPEKAQTVPAIPARTSLPGTPDTGKATKTKSSTAPAPNPDAKSAATPARSPDTKRAASAADKPVPARAADPNSPLDLTDTVRQGLSADLYLDATEGGVVPVYHFTSAVPTGTSAVGTKQHFCTISEEEKYKLIDARSKEWKYEGIAFFAYPEGQQPAGARPIYRFWSPSLKRYFFTMDEATKQMLIDKLSSLWQFQGVAWYAPPVKPSGKK